MTTVGGFTTLPFMHVWKSIMANSKHSEEVVSTLMDIPDTIREMALTISDNNYSKSMRYSILAVYMYCSSR